MLGAVAVALFGVAGVERVTWLHLLAFVAYFVLYTAPLFLPLDIFQEIQKHDSDPRTGTIYAIGFVAGNLATLVFVALLF